MNQTLEGHNGTVMCLAWNPAFRKLTTSDEKGLIIVWTLHRGMWYEEMINNRNKSVVMDMKWTADGKKICIIYEDGAVIVGSVDGNRLWGKELNLALKLIEWSPDGRLIIFITMEAEVFVYDSEGTKVKNLSLAALQSMDSSTADEAMVVGIDWYSGSSRYTRSAASEGGQHLCIAFDCGFAQISTGEDDIDPIIIDTELSLKSCKWSPDGSVISFIGSQNKTNTSSKRSNKDEREKQTNYIKFYSSNGRFLRQVRIPGDDINSITWEQSGLRIGLAVDAFIFFANVRVSYLWAYLENTVIFSYYRPERHESVVVFWDLTSSEAHIKYVPELEFLVACGDHCALILSENTNKKMKKTAAGPVAEKYTIQLRNSIGAIVHSKKLPLSPKYVSMGPNHLAVANDRTVYTWQFQSTVSAVAGGSAMSTMDQITSGRSQQSRERIFDIETISYSQAQSVETFEILTDEVRNPITCITISDRYLVVGRKSGTLTRFTLPHLNVENEYTVAGNAEPFRIELSCLSTKIGIIDAAGVFTMIDLDARKTEDEAAEGTKDKKDKEESEQKGREEREELKMGKRLKVERRDVWDMKWAEDNDDMVCVMEKTKLQVIRGETTEDPITSSGHLCRFKDLEIRSVVLDEILKQPIEQQPQPPNRDLVVDYESKCLREVREKMNAEGLAAGYQVAEASPHPRLFRLIAENALEALDLTMAEKAFVRCEDYHAIQLVRQLREMTDKMKARAEVAVYLKRYDEAEAVYREIDRKDLAIQMRKRIGDYPRVVQLLQTGGGNDQLMKEAWDKIGEQYADKFKWRRASQYFRQSRNMERLAECLYRLEQFSELAELRADIPDGTPLLNKLATQFSNLGMHEEAVDCFIRFDVLRLWKSY
jgi:WD repeat-containing protein 35